MVAVGILILFLILEEKFSVFLANDYDVSCGVVMYGFYYGEVLSLRASLVAQQVRISQKYRNAGDLDLIPGLGRSPGGAHGNPRQYSCLENPSDRGALWATVHEVSKSQTQLKRLSMHA